MSRSHEYEFTVGGREIIELLVVEGMGRFFHTVPGLNRRVVFVILLGIPCCQKTITCCRHVVVPGTLFPLLVSFPILM